MTSDGLILADGEEIVRSYACTAVDRVALVAGTVIPLPGTIESEGTITLTNRRLVFELDASNGSCPGSMRQETRLSDVTSISSMMSKFGRDLRMPILCMLVGFLLMVVPFLAFTESGAFEVDGDYEEGYNKGVEYTYFKGYLEAIQEGYVDHTIPQDYHLNLPESLVTHEYDTGFEQGAADVMDRLLKDISENNEFSVPYDMFLDSKAVPITLALAVMGMVVFVLGSVLYLVSNRTKDWIVLNFGTGGQGVFLTSINSGWRSTGYRAMTAEDRYWDMTREMGAAILGIRGYKERRLRFVEDSDDVVIIDDEEQEKEVVREELDPSLRESLLERTPDFDDDWNDSGELIIDDDDDDGPRIVGPWREG